MATQSESDALGNKGKKKGPALHTDLIFEILIRTEIECLPIFKWVCKEWFNLISERRFKTQHHQRAKNVCGYIFLPDREGAPADALFYVTNRDSRQSNLLPSLDFLPEPVRVEISTTQGLLCCVGLNHPGNYFICKPTTREWVRLPNPRNSYQTYKIDMDVALNDDNVMRFKILRISKYIEGGSQELNWEVFDSETWNWSQMEHIKLLWKKMNLNRLEDNISMGSRGTMVKGCYCWIEYMFDFTDPRIIVLDVWREDMGTLQLPQESLIDSDRGLASMDGDQLCLISLCGRNEADVWVMRSMKDRNWEKKWSFDIYIEFGWGRISDHAKVVVDETLLVRVLPAETWVKVLLKDGTWCYVVLDDWVHYPDRILVFRSDYFPCNIGKPCALMR